MRLIPEADATEHSGAINPVVELKPRATAGNPALVGAALAEVGEVVAEAAVVLEAVEEVAAVAVAEVVDDGARLAIRAPGIEGG